MSLDDVVNVTITSQTVAPTQAGFGTPCVVGYHTKFTERYRIYTSTTAMITDGFAVTDPIYLAVQAIFSQNPRPIRVVVGRTALDSAQTIRITPVAVASTAYTVYINSQAATYTSDATPTIAEITAGLKIAIDALGFDITTTDNTTSLDIAGDTAADAFSFYVGNRALITQENTTTDGGIATDLAAIRLEYDDWYGLILANPAKAIVAAAASYIEATKKIMFVSSADDAMYDSGSTTDIAYVANNAGQARTVVMHHPKALQQFPNAAWMGKGFPYVPGKITWKFKTLANVDSVIYTETEIAAMEAKECNYYATIAGLAITQQGVSASGEFIDITRGSDWTVARMQEGVFGKFASNLKVPYTDAGAAVVGDEVKGVLRTGVTNELFAEEPAPIVTVPLVANVPVADRQNRHLPDVRFSANWAGAIHSTGISGVISV